MPAIEGPHARVDDRRVGEAKALMGVRKPTVVVTEALPSTPLAWLRQRANVIVTQSPETTQQALTFAEGLVVRSYTQVDDALLRRAPALKVVGRAGVGLDNVDLDACRKKGVRVVHTPQANTNAVAEYVIGVILRHIRPLSPLAQGADAENFAALRRDHLGRQLSELIVGVLGFGRIGQAVAKIIAAFGAQIAVFDLRDEAVLRHECPLTFSYLSCAELLGNCDVISIHVDGREDNRGWFGGERLAQLRRGALLINTSRGFVIDGEALAIHAQAHPHTHFVLDVHDPEPPLPDDPLGKLDNIVRYPHVAARTESAQVAMGWVVQDVFAVLCGHPPHHPAV